MGPRSLEERLRAAGDPVRMLRNSNIGPYVYPNVPNEFTNWRDEQQAWRETCALLNQSHHMTDMYIEGPDAIRLLSDTGINTFSNFTVNKAKQFVCCNHDGYVIGDAILFFLPEKRLNLVGRPSAHNWVRFQAETGNYDVKLEMDERSAINPKSRKAYRYQLQGPNSLAVLEKLTGARLPDVKFFNMTDLEIAGRTVHGLHHGMAGARGLEIFGPWEDGETVRAAIIDAGREFGLRQVGSRAYPSITLESGWIPSPMPAVYSGEKMKAYREWLPVNGYEGSASLGGSFDSDDIEDYYLTPYDLGYGPFVSFDHDFIGRDALEKIAANPRRKKVTLAWDGDDVMHAAGTWFRRTGAFTKYFDMPLSNYATLPYDKVLRDGRIVGLSTFTGYSFNERSMLSLAMVDVSLEIGTEVTVVWGEPGGGSSKPTVEKHTQTEVRAIVSPVPYAEVARKEYAPGWRTA